MIQTKRSKIMKRLLLLLFITLFSTLHAQSAYERANEAAAKSLDSLDCEFEDCKKEAPKPKVIIKERVKVVEKRVPVIVEKKVVVEKPVIVEKRVFVEKEAPKKEKALKQIPQRESKRVSKQESTSVPGVKNRAFFDIYPNSQAPILDYITYSKRKSFDVNQYIDSVTKIHEKDIKVYIYGKLLVPKSITTKRVYVYTDGQYASHSCCDHWVKATYYNDSKVAQNSDYFLVDVLQDRDGTRYIKYKIYIHLHEPWRVKPGDRIVMPNTYHFQMAPNKRGFKGEFVYATPYIVEE